MFRKTIRRAEFTVPVLLLAYSCCAIATAQTAAPTPAVAPMAHHADLLLTVSRFMTHGITTQPVKQFTGPAIVDGYLKALDPRQSIFTVEEIDQFKSNAYELDPANQTPDLRPVFVIYARFTMRTMEKLAFTQALLDEQARRQAFPPAAGAAAPVTGWPASTSEMHEKWRREVAADMSDLSAFNSDHKVIAARLAARYETYSKRVRAASSNDIATDFIKSYVHSLDPQASYIVAEPELDKVILAQESGLSKLGISLEDEKGLVTITAIQLNGAADKSGQLAPGDRIVGIAQGPGGPIIDTVALPRVAVTELLRGSPGTSVTLEVVPRNRVDRRRPVRVSLVRSALKDQQLRATSSVVQVGTGKSIRRVGIISMPSFYFDFESRRRGDQDYLSATRDAAHFLEQFKKEGVEAVLLDLRNNGGGALVEAISLSGLFVKGTVLQQRGANGKVELEGTGGKAPAWDGPLAVLINARSVAASEIIAGALQDYGRALILGEQSYGSGAIQTMVDVGRLRNNPAYGDLKLTVAQFFRVNGSSTQIRGVTPDIILERPAGQAAPDDSRFENFLPWAEIAPARYTKVAELQPLIDLLAKRHQKKKAAAAKSKTLMLNEAVEILADQLTL